MIYKWTEEEKREIAKIQTGVFKGVLLAFLLLIGFMIVATILSSFKITLREPSTSFNNETQIRRY